MVSARAFPSSPVQIRRMSYFDTCTGPLPGAAFRLSNSSGRDAPTLARAHRPNRRVWLTAVWVLAVGLSEPAWAEEGTDLERTAERGPVASQSLSAPVEDRANSDTAPLPGDPITLRLLLSRSACRNTPTPCLFLKVEYAAQERTPRDRPPLNIALVLDSSASMAEERKLPYTLEAARMVIENAADSDILALVAFNNQAIVLSGAGRVVNKPFLLHRLDEIAPDNYTNLSAGLLEGIAQVSANSAAVQVKHVLLLTDGQANRGETSSAALRHIAQQAKRRGIGVSTFGVGSDFNEKLLADVATGGGGRYVYVGTPEEIPTAFQNELHGLLEVVAQNAVIEIAVLSAEIGRVYGQLLDEPTSLHKLVIGDLRATERGFILAELKSSTPDGTASLQADVRLVFDAPEAGARLSREASVRGPASSAPEDRGVALLSATLEALETADLAAQGLDVERYRVAKVSFERLYAEARGFAMRNRDQELLNQTFVLKHFMEELTAAENEGLLHGHQAARSRLQKESHYLRYLLTHHGPGS